MNFFHRTTSTRFWIRLRRHTSGHYEAVLSGLTCQDVFECLREEFEGRHLVLFAAQPGLDDLFSKTLKARYTTLGDVGRNPVYVVSPESVGRVLRAENLNENDAWWFFPYPKVPSHEDALILELKPNLGYFRTKPSGGLNLFVSCVRDLAVFTKSRAELERLIQRLFVKYVTGLGLLSAEEAQQADFIRQLEIDLDSLKEGGVEGEAHFTVITEGPPAIFKDSPGDWRRVVYEYAPAARRFERRETKQLSLSKVLLENWGAIVVWLSSVMLLGGTIVILIAFVALVVLFVLSFF